MSQAQGPVKIFSFAFLNSAQNTVHLPSAASPLSSFFPEPTLEGGAEHSEASGVSLSQPGGARRRAPLIQQRVVRLARNRLHAHIQQLLQGASWEDTGLPL